MNLSTAGSLVNARAKRKVTAGGPGSGRHPGFGQKLNNAPGTLMDKYFAWVEKPGHNPDVLSWYHNLDQKSTEMVHKFVDKIVKDRDAAGNVLPKQHVDPWDKPSLKAGGPGSGRHPGFGGFTQKSRTANEKYTATR